MNFLKRDLAPITDEAWKAIDSQARDSLRTALTVRRFADVRGPLGLDYVAVPRGRLSVPSREDEGAAFAVNRVQPLVEVRVPFRLSIWELDNISRGARDVDLDAVDQAAWKLARFEETTVYNGAPDAHVQGLEKASTHEGLPYNDDPEELLASVARGITVLRKSMVDGPYALVVTEKVWDYISSCVQGRPLRHHLEYTLGGPVIFGPFLETPMLVSTRGGDLELTLGQDISIGYHKHDTEELELYFTESFTFQVLDPSVMIFFRR